MNVGSYEFMGSRQSYLTSPSNPAYNIGQGEFTIEAWIHTFQGGPILARKVTEGTESHGGFFLAVGEGTIELVTDNGSGYALVKTTDVSICDGTWHHVAGVRQDVQGFIYLDGVAQPTTGAANAIPPLNINSNDRLTVGSIDQESHPVRQFDGMLAEVRLWNVARSAADIKSAMNQRIQAATLSTDLIGYWPGEFGIPLDFSPVRNQTTVVGMLMKTGSQPPIPVMQDDMKFLYTGIYDTWTRDLSPLTPWVPFQELVLTSTGFVVLNQVNVVNQAKITGTILSWPAQSGQPAISLTFLLQSSDSNFWDQPQSRLLAQGYIPGSSKYTIIKALLKPRRIGCGLVMNVATGFILASRSGRPVIAAKDMTAHDHFCEYEGGGILDMGTDLALQADSTNPGAGLSFAPPEMNKSTQSWTFQNDGTISLASATSVALSASENMIFISTRNQVDNSQKWLALSNSQMIYNGRNTTSVLRAFGNNTTAKVNLRKEGTPEQFWYTFRSAFISEAYGLALTVMGKPQDNGVGTALNLSKWDPIDVQQQFEILGSDFVHIQSGLLLTTQEDGTVILGAKVNPQPAEASWSLSQPVIRPPPLTDNEAERMKRDQPDNLTEYVVWIETGDYVAAGTNDRVEISLRGRYENLNYRALTNSELHSDPFERGCTDRFRFTDRDVGPITGFAIRYGYDTWFFRDRWVVNRISVDVKKYSDRNTFWTPSYGFQFEMPANFTSYFNIHKRDSPDRLTLGMAPAQDKLGSTFGWYHTWLSCVNPTPREVKTWFDCAGGHEGPGTIQNVISGSCSRSNVILMSTGFHISKEHPLQPSYGTNRTDGVDNANVRADGKLKWDGQCHQMANRYLWTCTPSISIDDITNNSKPPGYGLSVAAFGKYGVGFRAWAIACGFAFPPTESTDNAFSWIQTFIPVKEAANEAYAAVCDFRAVFSKHGEPDPNGPEVKTMVKRMSQSGSSVKMIANLLNKAEAEIQALLRN